MTGKKVFISYSHDSSEHATRVRGLAASLSRDGCECQIDAFKDTVEDWPAWMTRQLIEADFVLCVVTETYSRRFRGNELPDVGLGVGWEAGPDDYSAITLDPFHPGVYWAATEFPASANFWATQITQIVTTPAQLSVASNRSSTSASVLTFADSASGAPFAAGSG